MGYWSLPSTKGEQPPVPHRGGPHPCTAINLEYGSARYAERKAHMMASNNRPAVSNVEMDLSGRTLSFETGLVAQQADGAVVVRYGDSTVLTTVVGEREPNASVGFFPLTVDYEERMYAAGKIPGGFIKREGRPTEAATLAARLTDRPIRPLFPKGYKSEVQVITTVMSADRENDPDILSINGASAALTLSQIPWDGPIGAVRVGYIDGEIVVNPTESDLAASTLDMVVAGTHDAIMMVEGESDQVSEETLVAGIERAHDEIRRIVDLQLELQRQSGKEKWLFEAPATNETVESRVRDFLGDRLRATINNPDKVLRLEGTSNLREELLAQLAAPGDEESVPLVSKEIMDAFEAILKEEVRRSILDEGIRPDGRRTDEIRAIWIETGYLPRTHGSAIFTRGQTQVITIVTLGSTAEEQRLDSIGPEESKRYIHHYNFPPFSVGEVRRLRGTSRRDIGHGALAERALLAVIPDADAFPYTMRLVSEVVSSNGSTSMASVCGSTLALMDAGVPIAAPVAGIAMGLITESGTNRYAILSDIQGMEDALGDMDFKVAGTADGVTAIQMDIKVKGITSEIMREALTQAREGRLFILGEMARAIEKPRGELSKFAPRVIRLKINPEKIGAVIGPGGKMIRSIQEETGTRIDIEDDGTVSVASTEPTGAEAAIQRILGLTQELRIERGEIYNGKVVSIMPYGAFVEILPGKDGLVHISELSEDPAIRVNRVEDVLSVGDEITVMVTEVAPNGKVSLSRRAALTGQLPEPKPERPPRRDDDRGERGPRRDDRAFRGGPGARQDAPPRQQISSPGEEVLARPGDSRRRPLSSGDQN
ncbi:MAG: Polyribonucleotide nucleotidyltransferase [Thermomicrobiales bacterium]|nr:Polyribonucleotide nucleotidyltransferase [Thermomicrobiales bacterium]